MDIRSGTIIHTDDDGSFIVSEIGSGGHDHDTQEREGRGAILSGAERRSIRQQNAARQKGDHIGYSGIPC